MAKTFHKSVLTANDLLDGDAVWWTGSAWSRAIGAAVIADTPEAKTAMEAEASRPRHEAEVVGPYLVDVEIATGVPVPIARREAIRADRAPTFAYAGEAAPTRAAA